MTHCGDRYEKISVFHPSGGFFAVRTQPAAVFAQNAAPRAEAAKLSEEEPAVVTAQAVVQQILPTGSGAVILWDEVSRTKVPTTNASSTQGCSQQVPLGSVSPGSIIVR